MQWSWRIGRFAGTDITVHGSFVFVLLFLWLTRQPQTLWDYLNIVVFVVVLFGSVLLHEIGHTVAAHRFGIGVSQIVLWPLGGLAILEREPTSHGQRIVIYAAGPLVNIVLVVIAAVLTSIIPGWSLLTRDTLHPVAVLQLMFFMNLGLVVFNVIPAYPLDGGHILRSVLALVIGERYAVRVTIALSGVLAGVLLVFAVLGGNFLLVLTALLMLLATVTLHAPTAQRLNSGWNYLFDRAYWHLQRNEPVPAIAIYDRVLARQPNNIQATHNRAWAYLLRSDLDRAIPDYDRTIALNPSAPKPYADRGMSAHMAFQYDEALGYFERAASLGLDAAWFSLRRGYAQRALGNHEAALADFERAVALAPQEAAGYAARALTRLRLGNPQAALTDIDQSILLLPENAELFVYRSQIHWHRGEQALAAADSAQAFALDPQVALIHDEDCLLALWRGQLAWAEAHYQWATEYALDPERIEVGRGDAYRINDQHDLAIAAYDRALALKPNPTTVLARGQSFLASGDLARASADFNDVLARSDLPYPLRLARLGLAQVEAA